MGEISRALGAPGIIHHNGKEYKLSPITAEIMAEWETYLEDMAWEKLSKRVRRGKMNTLEYAQQSDILQQSIAAGNYGFFSRVSDEARANPFKPESRHFIFLRIKGNHPEVDDKMLLEMIEQELEQIMAKQKSLDAPDPNSQTPEKSPGENGSVSAPSAPA